MSLLAGRTRQLAGACAQLTKSCNKQSLRGLACGHCLHVTIMRLCPKPHWPQGAAAGMLCSLGRMEAQGESTLSAMSATMMAQVEAASTQSIASALQATCRAGPEEPPPPWQLVGSWVSQKLGLEGAT